jgi:hypothetical protein
MWVRFQAVAEAAADDMEKREREREEELKNRSSFCCAGSYSQ